jgi:hypothetical protein
MRGGGSLPDLLKNLFRSQSPRTAVKAGSGMGAGPAQEEVRDRRVMARPAEHRARDEQLIERQLTVKDVASGQAIVAFEVERRDDLPRDNRPLETGRVS